jgi:UrcA family protein
MNCIDMKSVSTKLVATCLAGVMALAGSLAAAASQPREEVLTLDAYALSTKTAQVVLARRIASAAKRVCSPLDSMILAVRREWQACIANAVEEAHGELERATAQRRIDDSNGVFDAVAVSKQPAD